ncbi:MAG: DUF7065 domain-containing protein [Candidatus Thorarchaeota archaeon SMTZ1-45]
MGELVDADEYAHEPTKHPAWRESYYFNWVDLSVGISGFSTIGLLPNISKREFVFALFYNDQREVYFVEPDGEVPHDFHKSLSNGVLSYKVVEPFKEWILKYKGRNLNANIRWTGRFPAYDFGQGSGTSWAGHFEQSGEVRGKIQLADGEILEFSGLGERDKSWGFRNWHIERWFALHAQFNELSIGLRLDTVDGELHPSGGISTASNHVPVIQVDLDTIYHEKQSNLPIGALTKVYGKDGSSYTLRSSLISPTSYVRFTREFEGGTTELFEEMATHQCDELEVHGTGLIEWLFSNPKKR